jgi:hypothetical protein
MSDSMIGDVLAINIRIIWPNTAQIKECAKILEEARSDIGTDPTAIKCCNTWKSSFVSAVANSP